MLISKNGNRLLFNFYVFNASFSFLIALLNKTIKDICVLVNFYNVITNDLIGDYYFSV